MLINSGQFYGTEGWNPKVIGFRILSLQAIFYTIVSFLIICVSAILTGAPYSTRLLFDYRLLNFSFAAGYVPIVSYILTSFPLSFAISCIVKRAKKCLDYVFTLYTIHFLLCWIIITFPSGWDWWIVNICSFLIMAFLSEYLCIRQEMKNIQFKHILGNSSNKKNKNKLKHKNSSNNSSKTAPKYKLRTSDPIPIDSDEAVSLLNSNKSGLDGTNSIDNNNNSININGNIGAKIINNENTINNSNINNGNDRALHSDTSDMEVHSNNNEMINLQKQTNDATSGTLMGSFSNLIRTGSKSLSRLRSSNKEDFKNEDEIVPLTSDNIDIKIV